MPACSNIAPSPMPRSLYPRDLIHKPVCRPPGSSPVAGGRVTRRSSPNPPAMSCGGWNASLGKATTGVRGRLGGCIAIQPDPPCRLSTPGPDRPKHDRPGPLNSTFGSASEEMKHHMRNRRPVHGLQSLGTCLRWKVGLQVDLLRVFDCFPVLPYSCL